MVKPLKRLGREGEMGGKGDGELFVTSKPGLGIWSFIDLEERRERKTEREDKKEHCASLPLVVRGADRIKMCPVLLVSLSLPLPFIGVYLMYIVLFK